MKKWIFSCWFLSFLGLSQSQNAELRGILTNSFSEPLSGYELRLSGTNLTTVSTEDGSFSLQLPPNFKSGDLVIRLFNETLQTVSLKKGESNVLDLGIWVVPQQESPLHLLSVDDLNELYQEDTDLDRGQIGSVLQSQRDIFLNTVAFQFSPTFFRLRGLDNSNQVVRINGVAMQSFLRGSPSWSQWGGLNDFTNRGQHMYLGSSSQIHGMGGFLSTTQIQLRPSAFRSGTKISQAFSNSSYRFRTQLSFVKDPQEKSFGYGFLFSRRWGSQGFVEGTFYDAWSGAAMIEKQWNSQHQTWFTAFYTPTRRGKNAPLTREVFNLKGRSYNPHWGLQEGLPRNSRTVRVQAPMMVFNHRWQFNENDFLQLNIGYQWGLLGSSRLLYNGHELKNQSLSGGGQNPDPVYYQYMPSYALRNLENPDYRNAFFLEEEIKQNGQIDWESLYQANRTSSGFGIYALYEDVQKWNRGSINLQCTRQLVPQLFFRAQGEVIEEQSQFFAMPIDLLGADFLWDYNSYAPLLEQIDSNLNNSNSKVNLETPFQYHYGIQSQEINLAASIDYSNLGLNSFLGGIVRYRSYLRDGYFRTGLYPQNSFGKGLLQNYTTFGIKGGLDYSLTGRHHLSLKALWLQKPPAFKNVYVNSRENQYVIPNSTFETNQQLVFQYLWQGERWTVML